MQKLKIVLSVLFVVILGLFVARIFIHPSRSVPREFPQSVQPQSVPPPITKAAVARPAPSPLLAEFRMAIILDDWGENFSLTRQAIEIGRPLTLSILPHLKYSKKKDAIQKELERAKKFAIKNGQVVVIGHDKKMTLAAI